MKNDRLITPIIDHHDKAGLSFCDRISEIEYLADSPIQIACCNTELLT